MASALISLAGLLPPAAVAGGFIPIRASLWSAGAIPGLAPVFLTPLTATLIHGGVVHLALNVVTLLFCGIAAERALGVRGIVILYGVGAYAAAAAQWAVGPMSTVPMIGASGAASAVIGAYATLYGQGRARSAGPLPAGVLNALWLLAAWTILNIMIGVLSAGAGMPIAAAAHVGGFAAGLALQRPLLIWRWRSA